jgi:uncharacterized protein (TIGR03000 family)
MPMETIDTLEGSTMRLRLSFALLVAMLFAAPASAQVFVGIGYGPVGYPTFRPFPYYPYGYLGYYPSAFSTQWSNGYSLYGPPVPTYGPVVGAFGGSDQRLNYTRLDDPRPFTRGPRSADDLVYPTFATVTLILPAADARVRVNGTTLPQTGVERTFRASNLPQGGMTRLSVLAQWTEGGKDWYTIREIDVRGGQNLRVELTDGRLPAPSPPTLAPPPSRK